MKKYKLTVLYPTSNKYEIGQSFEKEIYCDYYDVKKGSYRFYIDEGEVDTCIASYPVNFTIVELLK